MPGLLIAIFLSRSRRRPLKSAVERWETTISQLESRRDALQQQLADPALYLEQNKERLRALLDDQALVVKDLVAAEGQWLKASEALEATERES